MAGCLSQSSFSFSQLFWKWAHLNSVTHPYLKLEFSSCHMYKTIARTYFYFLLSIFIYLVNTYVCHWVSLHKYLFQYLRTSHVRIHIASHISHLSSKITAPPSSWPCAVVGLVILFPWIWNMAADNRCCFPSFASLLYYLQTKSFWTFLTHDVSAWVMYFLVEGVTKASVGLWKSRKAQG